jgi:hypothetical protein
MLDLIGEVTGFVAGDGWVCWVGFMRSCGVIMCMRLPNLGMWIGFGDGFGLDICRWSLESEIEGGGWVWSI